MQGRWLPASQLAALICRELPNEEANRHKFATSRQCQRNRNETGRGLRKGAEVMHLHRAAALFAGLDLDAEDAFEPLRPIHRDMLWHRTALPCPRPADPSRPRLATTICARKR
jgi:hypothetical protein